MDAKGQIQLFKDVLNKERNAIDLAIENLSDEEIIGAAKLILHTKGKLVVISLGKGGYVGEKISASFSSMGVPSFFTHATELFHGDFGRIDQNDTVLLITHSGETKEVVEAAKELKARDIRMVGITKSKHSTLSKLVDFKLNYGIFSEADHLNLAPTASSTVTLAIGDALMVLVSQLKDYKASDFGTNHPGGSLGKQLGKTI